MTDDERERLIAALKDIKVDWADDSVVLAQAAAQLRADGERIKALEVGLTPQTAAKFLVDEVLQKASPEAAVLRRRMMAAGMRVRVPHLTRWVRWALINVVLRDLAKSAEALEAVQSMAEAFRTAEAAMAGFEKCPLRLALEKHVDREMVRALTAMKRPGGEGE